MTKDWPYQITTERPDWHYWYLAQQWCETNVGVFDQDWYKLGINHVAHGKIRSTWLFRREQDAVAFALRWS